MDGRKVAVITGGSSGIGRSCAAKFAENGYTVYEISRHGSDSKSVRHITADVTNSDALDNALSEIIRAEGTIDCLITCAGMGVSGAVEFISDDDMYRQFNVNLFGTIGTVKRVIPFMRTAGKGRIICISSVAAVYSIPFQTYYSASKAAINSFVCGLRNELKPFNIDVCAVMPGDVHTGFTDVRCKSHAGDDVYGGCIDASVAVMEHDEQNGMSPDTIASFIYKTSQKKHFKPLYTPGVSYKLLVFLRRLLPDTWLYALVGKLYVKKGKK